MKTLITGALTAEAARLKNVLQHGGEVIILADSALPDFILKNSNYIQIPDADDSSFVHKMLSISLNSGVEKLYPLRGKEIQLLSEAKVLFQEYGINIII